MTKINSIDFDALVKTIQEINGEFAAQASRAVNVSLTLRNWCIGAYIHGYELNGSDRAQYGEGLLINLSEELKRLNVSACGKRQLYNYLRFYQIYPQIMQSVTAKLQQLDLQFNNFNIEKVRSTTALLSVDPQKLLNKLSYTHIEQLRVLLVKLILLPLPKIGKLIINILTLEYGNEKKTGKFYAAGYRCWKYKYCSGYI